MEPPYLGVPFAYELNRKAFRLERSQFGDAALNNSLRPGNQSWNFYSAFAVPLVDHRAEQRCAAVRVSVQITVSVAQDLWYFDQSASVTGERPGNEDCSEVGTRKSSHELCASFFHSRAISTEVPKATTNTEVRQQLECGSAAC
jgi:hypothetical protein